MCVFVCIYLHILESMYTYWTDAVGRATSSVQSGTHRYSFAYDLDVVRLLFSTSSVHDRTYVRIYTLVMYVRHICTISAPTNVRNEIIRTHTHKHTHEQHIPFGDDGESTPNACMNVYENVCDHLLLHFELAVRCAACCRLLDLIQFPQHTGEMISDAKLMGIIDGPHATCKWPLKVDVRRWLDG